MRRALRHIVRIMLGEDAAAVQDEKAVGVARIEKLAHRLAHAVALERDGVEVTHGARQRGDRPRTASHLRGRYELAYVLEGPAVPRRAVPVLRRYGMPWSDPRLPRGRATPAPTPAAPRAPS